MKPRPNSLSQPAPHAHGQPKGQRLDKIGIALSGLCLVHCMAVPVVLTFFPVLTLQFFPGLASETFHIWMAAILLVVGGFAFVQGYLHHRHGPPLALGLVGTALLFVGALNPGHLLASDLGEHLVTVLGTLCLIAGHVQNRRSHRRLHPHHAH